MLVMFWNGFRTPCSKSGCYGETYEEALLQSARKIVDGWGQTSLTSEQIEAVEELRNIEENPYPWEYVDE